MLPYFQQLNKYYDKIFVLSVADAADRRALFAKRFEGLDYTFFYGADKNKFTIEEIIANGSFCENLTRKNHRYNKTMRLGEIACSWSHKMMYEEIISKNYNHILIFEDDAVPDEQLLKQIPSILNEIPKDCELLMWGWNKNGKTDVKSDFKKLVYHFQHLIGKLKWDHNTIRNIYAKPFSQHLKKAGFHDYTYAYSITQAAAKKLVAMQTPIQYIADNLLAHAITTKIITAYIAYPAVFLHDVLPDGTPKESFIR